MTGKRHLEFAVFALAVSLALSTMASASEITGNVVLSGEAAADVVISIEGLAVEGGNDGTVLVLDHRGLNFVPHVLVVRAGTAVRFENSDGMPCRIYSISPAGVFVLRRHDGKPMTVTFDRPGIVEVRCADHGQIYAYIVVKENPYFALTDPKGRYQVSKVPPGRYTLQAWYEGMVVKKKTIRVGADNLTIDWKVSRPQRKAQRAPALSSILRTEGLPTGLPASLSFSELSKPLRSRP